MYDMKALYEAESVENAVALRLEHPEAQIIAGGSDVLVQMREGKRAGAELILRGHYALYAVQRPANTVAVQRCDPVQLYHPGGNALFFQQLRRQQRLLRQDTVGHDSRVCPLTEHRH